MKIVADWAVPPSRAARASGPSPGVTSPHCHHLPKERLLVLQLLPKDPGLAITKGLLEVHLLEAERRLENPRRRSVQ
eukprot:6132504-Pyramimonas_sp.AAC.1